MSLTEYHKYVSHYFINFFFVQGESNLTLTHLRNHKSLNWGKIAQFKAQPNPVLKISECFRIYPKKTEKLIFLFLFISNLIWRDIAKPKKHFCVHFLSAIRWRFHISLPTFRLSAVIVNFLFLLRTPYWIFTRRQPLTICFVNDKLIQ